MRVVIKQRQRASVRLKSIAYSSATKADRPGAETGTDNQRYMTAYLTDRAIDAANSPFKFHAEGDGSADDLTAYRAAEDKFSVVRLPEGSIFNLGTDFPLKPVSGPGAVKIAGVTFDGNQPVVDIYRSSMFMTPGDYATEIGFPTGDLKQNIIFSVGSKAQEALALNRVTAFGGRNFTVPGATLDRVEAFGDGAGRLMKFGERNSFFGSIAGEQFGTQDITQHPWWYEGGGFVPGEVGWDFDSLETNNPGIGAKIAAAAETLAASTADVARNAAFGRDALNGAIRGVDSVAFGYRALAGHFVADRSSAFGVDSLRRGVFLHAATAVGYRNGYLWQEGTDILLAGRDTFFNTVRGSNVIGLGLALGAGLADVNDTVLIGRNVLNDNGLTELSNVFAVAISGGNPLLAGKFNAGSVGINILPDKLKGRLHIRTSDFGAEAAVNGTGDELVIESSGSTGMTVRSGATALGSIYFDRSGVTASGGYLQYNHNNGTMLVRGESESTLQVGSTKRVQANGTGLGFNGATPIAKPTLPSSGTVTASDLRTVLINYGLAA